MEVDWSKKKEEKPTHVSKFQKKKKVKQGKKSINSKAIKKGVEYSQRLSEKVTKKKKSKK